MKLGQKSWWASLFVLCLALSSTVSFAELDKLVAIVGDQVITKSEFDHAKSLLFHMEPKMKEEYDRVSQKEKNQFEDQIFQDLLTKKLVIQQANSHDIHVEDADFDHAIKQMAANNHLTVSQLYDKVAAQGVNLNRFKRYVREQVHVEKYLHLALNQDLFVSDQDVQDFLRQAQHETARYHLSDFWIETKTDDSKKMMQDFAKQLTAAKGIKSEDARFSTIQNEDLGERLISQIPMVFHDAIPHMASKQASEVIDLANGYHVLWMESIERMDAVKARNSLLNQRFAKKRQKIISEMRALAFIKDMRSE